MDYREQIRLEAERIKKKMEERKNSGSGSGDSDFTFFQVGHNYFRLIPPMPGSPFWARPVLKHYNLPAGVGDQPCFSPIMYPGTDIECPYCKVLNILSEYTDEVSPDPSVAYYPNIALYKSSENGHLKLVRTKPFLVRCCPTVYDALVMLMQDPLVGIEALLSEGEACFIDVIKPENFEGKNNYQVQVLPARSTLDPDPKVVEQLLKSRIDTFKIWKKPGSEQYNQAVGNAKLIAQHFREITKNLDISFSSVAPPTTSVPSTPSALPASSIPSSKYWVAVDGKVSLMQESEVKSLKDSGKNFHVMPEDQKGGWVVPETLGF